MKNEKRKSRKRNKEISIKTNAPKITNSTCAINAGNTSENLLNGIRQIVYPLHRRKRIAKKVYDNINESIQI